MASTYFKLSNFVRRGLERAKNHDSNNATGGLDTRARNLNSRLVPSSGSSGARWALKVLAMKIKNSIKTLRTRHRDNQVVRRRGRLYIINKTVRRYKARQG